MLWIWMNDRMWWAVERYWFADARIWILDLQITCAILLYHYLWGSEGPKSRIFIHHDFRPISQ
jgi:hypothetical protein